jgi:hypothetical protein
VIEPLRTTLADAVSFLEAEHIGYALIGGLAVSLRGQPRVTADVDLVIAANVERALSLVDKLAASMFKPLFEGIEEVVEQAFILPLRHRHTNVKVDLALGLSGFEQQAVLRAERLRVAGSVISVATTEDLVIMKVLAGRPQDEQDLQGLIIAQGAKIDWDYCRKIAVDLGEAIGQPLVSRIESLRTGQQFPP